MRFLAQNRRLTVKVKRNKTREATDKTRKRMDASESWTAKGRERRKVSDASVTVRHLPTNTADKRGRLTLPIQGRGIQNPDPQDMWGTPSQAVKRIQGKKAARTASKRKNHILREAALHTFSAI